MSGGGGHVIIRRKMASALSDPIVHGQIPAEKLALLDQALEKDVGEWTDVEDAHVKECHDWAVNNCT